jgi:hypothetical protein
MLYMLKSTRTNQYLQENLQILAMPSGWCSKTSYATRWVRPDVWGTVKQDETVCLVLSPQPYERFVPTRRGNIKEVIDEAGDLTLTVEWNAFVNNLDVDAFSDHFRDLNAGQYFVVRDSETPPLFTAPDTYQKVAWHQLVQALRDAPGNKMSPYARTVFLRVMPLVDEEKNPVPALHLQERTTYEQVLYYNLPSTEDGETYRAILEPGESDVQLPEALRLLKDNDGRLSFPILPLSAERAHVECWVSPNRMRSTTLSLNYTVEAAPESAPAERTSRSSPRWPPLPVETAPAASSAPIQLADRDLRSIFGILQEDNRDERRRKSLALIDQTLSALAPDSTYLREQRGLLLCELKRWEEAYVQFNDLNPDNLRPLAIVKWFVSACRAEIDADFGDIIDYFNAWEQRALTDQLIDALPLVNDQRRLEILTDAWIGGGRYNKVWETVKDTFEHPDHLVRAVEVMVDEDLYHLLSPGQGYTYLKEKFDDFDAMPMEVLEKTVVWGLEEPDQVSDLDQALLTWIQKKLSGDDPLEASEYVEKLRPLSPDAWMEASEMLADTLALQEDPQLRIWSCETYIELARVARERYQDVGLADTYLYQAHQIVGEAPDLLAKIHAEEEKWRTTVEQLEDIQTWREGLYEVQLQRVRDVLTGRRAIFVGGRNQGFDEEEARRELGLAEAEFVPHFGSERGSLDKVRERIHQGKVDYLVDFIRFGAHRNLDGDCERAGVTYVRVRNSRSLMQIVKAFKDVHGIQLR